MAIQETDNRLTPVHTYPSPVETNRVSGGRVLPYELIRRYALLAAHRAVTKQRESGTWFAETPNFPGVWAEGSSEDRALAELEDVVCDWAILKLESGHRDLPLLEDINLNVG